MIQNIKFVFYCIGMILLTIGVIVAYIFISRKLKAENSTITLYPKLRIKKIETNDNVDKNDLEGAVRLGMEALKKIKEMQKK